MQEISSHRRMRPFLPPKLLDQPLDGLLHEQDCDQHAEELPAKPREIPYELARACQGQCSYENGSPYAGPPGPC
jgi:hypothetical protein